MTDNTSQISELVVVLKDRIGLTKISAATIHIVLKEAMELVEELQIPGSEKKAFASLEVSSICPILFPDTKMFSTWVQTASLKLVLHLFPLVYPPINPITTKIITGM